MNCKKCGEHNADGAKFCNNCGSPLDEVMNEKTTENSTEVDYSKPTKNNNLIIILSLTGVLITAVIILILLLVNKGGIEGKWYNPTQEIVLEFRGNDEVIMHTTSGAYLGTYTYDNKTGEGTIAIGDVVDTFESEDNKVIMGDESEGFQVYIKMDDELDVESMVSLQDNPAQTDSNTQNIQNTPTPDANTTMEATPTIEITAAPTPTAAPTDTPFVPTPPPETPTPTAVVTATPTNTPLVFVTMFTGIILYNPVADIEGTWESQFTTDDSVYTFYDDYEFMYHPGGLAIWTTGTYTYDDAANTGVMTADGTYTTTNFEYDESSDILYVNGINPYVRQP